MASLLHAFEVGLVPDQTHVVVQALLLVLPLSDAPSPRMGAPPRHARSSLTASARFEFESHRTITPYHLPSETNYSRKDRCPTTTCVKDSSPPRQKCRDTDNCPLIASTVGARTSIQDRAAETTAFVSGVSLGAASPVAFLHCAVLLCQLARCSPLRRSSPCQCFLEKRRNQDWCTSRACFLFVEQPPPRSSIDDLPLGEHSEGFARTPRLQDC